MSLTRTLRQKFPFLRYSLLRMAFGGLSVKRTGQMGDGREEAMAGYVIANAPAGDVDAAIDAIDSFAYDKSILMNVGDEKGQLLGCSSSGGRPSSTKPTSSIRRYSKTWFWSRSSWAEPSHHHIAARKATDPMLGSCSDP